MTYELWAVRVEQTPELVGTYDNIARAALRMAAMNASHDPERWAFWIVCPERVSDENPEGISLSDFVVLKAADDLAQSRRRRRVYLSNASERLGVSAKGRDLSELLRLSLGVLQGKYELPKRLPTPSQLAEVHWQLRFV